MAGQLNTLINILLKEELTPAEKKQYQSILSKLSHETFFDDNIENYDDKDYQNKMVALEKLYFLCKLLGENKTLPKSKKDLVSQTNKAFSSEWDQFDKDLPFILQYTDTTSFPKMIKDYVDLAKAAQLEKSGKEGLPSIPDDKMFELSKTKLKEISDFLENSREDLTNPSDVNQPFQKARIFEKLNEEIGGSTHIFSGKELNSHYQTKFAQAIKNPVLYQVTELDLEGVYHAVPLFHQTKPSSCWNAVINSCLLQSDINSKPNKHGVRDYLLNLGYSLFEMEDLMSKSSFKALSLPKSVKKNVNHSNPMRFSYGWTYKQLSEIFKSEEIDAIKCTGLFLGSDSVSHDVTLVGVVKRESVFGGVVPHIMINDPLKAKPYQLMSLKKFNKLMTETRKLYIESGIQTNNDADNPRLTLFWYKPSTKNAMNNLYAINKGKQALISENK